MSIIMVMGSSGDSTKELSAVVFDREPMRTQGQCICT